MLTITYCLLFAKDSPVVERIIDWSYATLLATVTVYHAARGVDELSRNKTLRISVPLDEAHK